MTGPISIFYFIILIFSIIVHEVAHGLMAEKEGDPTARLLGRITLNPIKHIDWLGSIILPAVLILSGSGLIVGWAKPVPYNPDRLRNGNTSIAKVSIAGIVVNLMLAVLFGLAIRIGLATGYMTPSFLDIASIIVLVNIVLALFNAIPLAPLDGFRFISAILPYRFEKTLRAIEQYSFPLLLLFIFFGWKVVAPFAFTLFGFITGISI
jgi:Zn-dependent protease